MELNSFGSVGLAGGRRALSTAGLLLMVAIAPFNTATARVASEAAYGAALDAAAASRNASHEARKALAAGQRFAAARTPLRASAMRVAAQNAERIAKLARHRAGTAAAQAIGASQPLADAAAWKTDQALDASQAARLAVESAAAMQPYAEPMEISGSARTAVDALHSAREAHREAAKASHMAAEAAWRQAKSLRRRGRRPDSG